MPFFAPRTFDKSVVARPVVFPSLPWNRSVANTGNAPIPYAQLQLLMRQVDGGERTWSLSLGGDYCLRRVGKLVTPCIQCSPMIYVSSLSPSFRSACVLIGCSGESRILPTVGFTWVTLAQSALTFSSALCLCNSSSPITCPTRSTFQLEQRCEICWAPATTQRCMWCRMLVSMLPYPKRRRLSSHRAHRCGRRTIPLGPSRSRLSRHRSSSTSRRGCSYRTVENCGDSFPTSE